MDRLDLLTIGNAVIDAFLGIHEANRYCRVSEESKELCIKYGQKIALDTCDFLLGGNACNVAVGLSRLGFKAGLCAEIGDDEFSQKIIKGVKDSSVYDYYVIKTSHTSSSFSIGLNFKNERTLFIKHTVRKHEFNLEKAQTSWVYLTSIGEEWRHIYVKTAQLADNKSFKLILSPGTHQLDKPYEEVEKALRTSDVLCINKEEAQLLTRFYLQKETNEEKELLQVLQNAGPGVVVITDGMKGSFAIGEDKIAYHIDVYPNNPIERTGAGDAYAVGFLSVIMKEGSVQDAMKYGSVNSASVVEKIGAQPGLLTVEQANALLRKYPEYKAMSI